MTLDHEIATATAAMDMIDDANRNGVVNARGYTDDGTPIGGHYTADAMGSIASANAMLESIGAETAPF